jgi:hypothetical protein
MYVSFLCYGGEGVDDDDVGSDSGVGGYSDNHGVT